VSGNFVAGLKAAWTITRTFLRLAISLIPFLVAAHYREPVIL
jgi:hypothetical protein